MNIGFIDYYLDEWHANNYPKWIEDHSEGRMHVSLAYGMIDSPIGGRTNTQWSVDMGIPLTDSIETLVAACDGIIVLSPDNCEMHETLSRVPLMSGKPTYIDKTFAPDHDTAKRIFDLAEAYGTPCYSTSALRYATEYENIGAAQHIVSRGPNGFETYSIHQLEPVMMLIKSCPSKVMFLPATRGYTMHIAFDGGQTAVLHGFEDGSPFAMDIVTAEGITRTEVHSDFFGGFMDALVAFFLDPTRIVPHGDTLRIMAVRGAGVKAMKAPGTWVDI